MELRYAHLADHVSFDQRGKPILVSIFEVIVTQATGALAMPRSALLAAFRASPLEGTEHHLELRLTGPDGEDVIPRQTFPLQLQPSGPRRAFVANVQLDLSPITLPGFGEYAFRFYQGEEQIGEVPLRVETMPTPDSLQNPPADAPSESPDA